MLEPKRAPPYSVCSHRRSRLGAARYCKIALDLRRCLRCDWGELGRCGGVGPMLPRLLSLFPACPSALWHSPMNYLCAGRRAPNYGCMGLARMACPLSGNCTRAACLPLKLKFAACIIITTTHKLLAPV
mgnify:CR=1 FL=1